MAPLMTWLATVGGWLIPGLGHLILRRWGRAAVIFLCVGGMTIAGYRLGGQVFSLRTSDIYSILGHLAEAGSGVFYFLWPLLEPAGADISRAAGDIGTRLLAIAGLLNFLCVIDAFEISRRAKQ
jgi:hypothetical protein